MPGLSTRAAVYSGIIATDVSPVSTPCGSANCTWPTICTLGICGECAPVNTTGGCDQSKNWCSYSTPSGTATGIPMDTSGHASFTVAPSNGTNHEMNSTSQAYISVFDIMEVSRFPSEDVSVWADECALWFCVQAINISVSEGQESQVVVGNWSQTRLDYPNSAHETEYIFENIPDEFNAVPGTRYAVTEDAMTALRNFMDPLIKGTVSSDVRSIDYSSDWIEAIWNATYDLPYWMSNLALSMSNEVRLQGHGDSGDYNGFATQMAPFIDVQWLWTIYPATLLVASIYYLLHTIAESSKDGVSVWKSGVLPMLFCRIDRQIHEKVGHGMDIPDGLEERVGRTKVALERTPKGEWTFKTTED